jgi:hypothetical protein
VYTAVPDGSSILLSPAKLFLDNSVQRVLSDIDNLAVVEGVPGDVVELREEIFAVDIEAAILYVSAGPTNSKDQQTFS